MANLKEIVYLSNADANELFSYGSVTIDGTTLVYDEDTVYMTPIDNATTTEDGLMSASDKSKLDSINLSNYLPLTGGTLAANTAPILTLKRTTSSAGAFLDFKNNNQDTNYWRTGVASDNYFYLRFTSSGSSSPMQLLRVDTSGNILLNNNQYIQWNNASGTTINVMKLNSNNNLIFDIPNGIAAFKSTIIPFSTDYDNTYDLGSYTSSTAKARWRNLYLSGTIRNDNANYGLSLPTMTSWTANKTIATTDQIPNTFTGTAATISVSGTPSGSVTLDGNASSGVSYISAVSGGTGTTKYFHPSFSSGSASATSSTATTVASSTHTHALTASGSVSLTANAESATGRITYLQDVTHTAASLTGTTTFNTDAIKSVALSASTTSTDGPTYIESVTGASGTTNYLHFTAGTTPPSSASPSHTSTDTAATTATGVSVVTGITAGSGTLTSVDTQGTGDIAYIASASHTAASLGTASTGTVTISNGSYSISASRSTSGSGTSARRTLTVSLSGSAPSLGGTTTFVTGYPNFSGGSASHTTKYLHHTHTSASASGTGTAASNTHTHKYDKTTSVSLTAGTAPSLTLNTTSSGGLGVIVSVSGGTGTTKYMKVTTSAASTGTVGISGGSISKTTKYLSAGFTGSSATTSSISGTTNVASTSHTHSVTGTVSLGSNTTSTDGVAYTESVTAASGTSKKLSASFSGSSTTSTGSYTPAGSISHS